VLPDDEPLSGLELEPDPEPDDESPPEEDDESDEPEELLPESEELASFALRPPRP
jgi:hypothetical protein